MAYDESGALKGEQTINSESDEISLKLSEGAYHITALSGQGNYTEPSSYNQQSVLINIPTAGYASSPLMMGGADVLLTSASAKVNVVMTYRVASLSLSLESVPEDVSAVSVGVSQQYKAIDMSGTFSGSSTANVKCTKTGDVWTSEQVYLLPGAGSSTTLTLSLTNAEGQTSYSYELSEPLMAAVPYTIKGTYVESTAPYITGVITIEGWQEERSFDFEFGSGSSSGGAGVVTPTNDVTAIPEPSSVWNGHIVALVDNATSTEADVLLLGLREMKNVFAPAAEGHETQMQDSVQAYFENDMKDWAVRNAGSCYDYGRRDTYSTVHEGGSDIKFGRMLDELGWEFCQEGRRRQDLIRFGVFTTKSWFSHDASDATKNLYPIPNKIMLTNSNLKQNPGY